MIRRGSLAYQRLFDRDEACVWHGRDCDPETLVPQHRANRGIGGYRAGDALSNVVLLCAFNSLVESDSVIAAEARQLGIKISRHADPRTVPIQHQLHGLVLLDDDGGFKTVDVECVECFDHVRPGHACSGCGRYDPNEEVVYG